MSDADTHAAATPDAKFRIVINAPIERIWNELTKTDEAQGAIFNAWLHTAGLAPGNRMAMRTGSGKHTLVIGKILEVDPPRRFVHTHRFTQYDDAECRVSYDLKPVEDGEGVEVTLSVFGLPKDSRTSKDMVKGGDWILTELKTIAEKGKPRFATRLIYVGFNLMEWMLPKRTKTANWPM